MYKILVLTLTLVTITTCISAELRFRIDVPYPELTRGRFEIDLPVMQRPGEPMLPYVPLRILLPQGETVTDIIIETREAERKIIDIEIPFFGKQTPISTSSVDQNLPLKPSGKGVFPHNTFQEYGTQRKMGYDILILNLYPYKYDADTRIITYIETIELSIMTEYNSHLAEEQNRSLVTTEATRNEIRRLVDNPEIVDQYIKQPLALNSILPDPAEPHAMIVITDAVRAPYFSDYMEWKNNNEISTTLFLLEDIYSSYSGVDNQEKIRNFIIDAHETYSTTSTPLDYVLLGGDDQIVPVRGMYCFVTGLWTNYEDYHIPSDVYYSNLEGNWDANGNGIYGELDDGIDWFAEVAVGRIPAVTEQDFNNFFYKNMQYANAPSFSNDIAIMIGQNLDSITWGGDYKDEIIPILPESYHIATFYEKDGSYDVHGIREAVNKGLGILNHLGHSNENTVFGMTNYQVNQLRNEQYGLAYSQGCYTAAFDNGTTQDTDSIGQRMVNAAGGFFAFIGNTRYGWYWPGSTEGASQLFDLTFFRGLFEEDIRHIGKTLNYSKETLVNEAMANNFEHHLWQNGFMLWTFYNQILFGDPSANLLVANGFFPYLEPVNITYDDTQGDNDGVVNPGEIIKIYIELLNREGWSDASSIRASLVLDDDDIEIIVGEVTYSPIPSGNTVSNQNPFIIKLSNNIPYNDYRYTLTISAESNSDYEFLIDYELFLPVSIKQRFWPWISPSPIQAAPLVYEDDPLFTRIIALDAVSNISFLDFRGESIILPIENEGLMMKSGAMGNLKNDGNQVIVINNRSGLIAGIDLHGNYIFTFNSGSQFINSPVLADISGNGELEIISYSIDRKLYLLNSSGNVLPGFPRQYEYNLLTEMAAADINNNGMAEIIIGFASGDLAVLKTDGNSLPGFPVNIGSPVTLSPIVLDNRNIITGTQNNKLYMVNPTGQIEWEKQLNSRIISEPIAADFDRNGSLDLGFVTANGDIYLMKQTGEYFEGFPVIIGETISQPPLAADLDNSGNLNLIFVTNSGLIYALNPDGTYIDMLPAQLDLQPNSPLFMADIDRDGDFEIGYGTNLGISLIDYKLIGGDDTPWSVYRGNTMRTGFYNDNKIIRENIYIPEPPKTELLQNYPNPFNITTTIPFYLETSSTMTMSIYNIRGQKIRELHNAHTEQGAGEVIWDGRNDSGRVIASGIYFSKMSVPGRTQVRKMLLLK